jgi:hypothetical protein
VGDYGVRKNSVTQASWNGVYSGLYSMKFKKSGVPKPTEECFGKWIIDDQKNLKNFIHRMKTDLWTTTEKDYELAWKITGNLMFKNEDVCHFRIVAQDLLAYYYNSFLKQSKAKL